MASRAWDVANLALLSIVAICASACLIAGSVIGSLQLWYGFPAQHLSAWQGVLAKAQSGASLPLGFAAIPALGALLFLTSTVFALMRAPRLAIYFPHLADAVALLRIVCAPPRRSRVRVKPLATPSEPPPLRAMPAAAVRANWQPELPVPPQATKEDRVSLSRILALQDVWTEPPPEWMKACLRDETGKMSDPGWLLILELGAAAPALLRLLSAQGHLPDIAEFGPLLAITESSTRSESGITPAVMTVGAAWLCEALDNLLASIPDLLPKHPFDPAASTSEAMLWRAIRAMSESDWRSLDGFPERASKVRTLTDRFAAHVRLLLAGPAQNIAKRLETNLLHIGLTDMTAIDDATFLIETGKGAVLIQAVDLQQRHWHLPPALDGDWCAESNVTMAPLKRLRQKAARWALRHGRDIRMTILALDHGSIERMAAAEGNSQSVDRAPLAALAWLTPGKDELPGLRELLAADGILADRQFNVRPATARPILMP